MAAFQFPDPAVETTVVNPITGSTYQWKEPPGKWVVVVKMREIGDIIWEGDNPPDPIGDYKLWYSTDTLQLYFYYCDAAGTCDWLPTSLPITTLEELIEFAAQAEVDIDQLQYKQQLLQNAVDQIYLEVHTGAGNRPPIFSPTEPDKHPDYAPPEDELIAGDIWYDNTDPDNLEQYIYDGSNWVIFGGQFVHRKGSDSMEGPLTVTGDRNADPDTGIQSSVKVLNVDSGQNSSLQLKFNGTSKVYIGSNNTSFQHDIKFAQNNKQVYSGSDTDKKGLSFHSDGVQYFGDYTEDKHVATKKDVEEAIYHDRTDPDTNKYVDRSGDVMDGDLVLDESRLVFRNPVNNQTLIKANRDSGKFPVILDLVNNNTVGSTLGGYDIKIGGSTSYNQLRFVGQDTYLSINGGGGSNTPVKFHKDVDCGNIRFTKLGPAIDDKDAVNYGQIKQELQEFRDELIQNLSFGSWIYNGNLGIQPPAGRCYFRNEAGQTSALTPSSVVQMVFNEEDALGANGAFDRIDVGEIISLTDGNVTIKYKVNSAASTSGPQNEVRSFEVVYLSQTGAWTFVDGGVWTFTLTEFGDISVDQLDDTYLRLDCANDPLDTELEIKTPDFGEAALTLNGKRDNDNNSTATIAFKNQYNTDENYVGYLTYRTKGDDTAASFFRFNQDVDLNGNGLQNASYVQFKTDGLIKHNANDRIKFQSKSTANPGEGLIEFIRPPNNGRRGITIRGKHPDDNKETDILWTYTNATGGDAVNYDGKMSSDTNLVNKGYVDSLLDFNTYSELS